MSDTSANPAQEQSVSAQFNKKKNTLAYAGNLYVNSTWKTWCWVLLIIFIIIPAAIGIITIAITAIAIGSVGDAVQDAITEGSSPGTNM